MPTTSAGTTPRLNHERLVGAARNLLVEGGTDRIVIREVARTLSVVPSALYKHVDGRDGLLTLLIAALYAELTDAVVAARDAVPTDRHRGRLLAATEGMRVWARSHPAEFDLLFGLPVRGYRAPEAGPTTTSARRFGHAFGEIFGDALAAGRLRVREDTSLPGDMAEQLAAPPGPGPLAGASPGSMYPFVMGFQRMLGLVLVEITGQLGWAMADPTPLTDEQLERLVDELLTPGT